MRSGQAGLLALAILFLVAGCGRESQWTYEVDLYWTVDPALVTFAPDGEWPTGFDEPRALAVGQDDTVYLAGDRALRLFALDGALRGEIPLDAPPHSLAVDEEGRLYVGFTDTIQVFLPVDHPASGDPPLQRAALLGPLPDDARITSLAADLDDLYAADVANRVILRLDREGGIVGRIGRPDEARRIPGILLPNPQFDVALGADGLIRVNNPGRLRVEIYSAEGHLELYWGEPGLRTEGFSGCCNPAGLAILPNGHYITSEKGLIRIKEYDPEGVFVGVVAGPDQLGPVEPLRVHETPQQSQVRGFGVAADADGRVYVLDVVRNVIRIFEKKN